MSKFLSGLRLGKAIKGFLPTGGHLKDFSPKSPSLTCEVGAL